MDGWAGAACGPADSGVVQLGAPRLDIESRPIRRVVARKKQVGTAKAARDRYPRAITLGTGGEIILDVSPAAGTHPNDTPTPSPGWCR
jgi:hypothetical protein